LIQLPPTDALSAQEFSPNAIFSAYPVIVDHGSELDDAETGLIVSPAFGSIDDTVLTLRFSHARAANLIRHAISFRNSPFESIVKTKFTFNTKPDDTGRHLLKTDIYWRLDAAVDDSAKAKPASSLLRDCFIREIQDHVMRWSPEEFYQSVYSPPLDGKVEPKIQDDQLGCRLYPFQMRAVQWLLDREGVTFQNGQLVQKSDPDITLPLSFSIATDAKGQQCYVSSTLGVITRNTDSVSNVHVRGGILAEEMGLGKTVELIALMCLHKRSEPSSVVFDDHTQIEVTTSGATLIITPPHILQQWMNEIEMHAPHLRVLHYKGMSSINSELSEQEIVETLLNYDVVLTTYNILSREIHWAATAPDRNLRHAKTYERRRSPLVLTSWWRVCLDEAQMIESGVSQAALVAGLIPRVNAWSVTGTPIKKGTSDLEGLLCFLRYRPFSYPKVWARMDRSTFKQIFGTIALRHSKDQVRHELRLPPQKRVVITSPFTAVEDQHYLQLFQEMCNGLGVNSDGSPAKEDYDPQSLQLTSEMRAWLRRLRQTCLHPHMGRKKKTLGRGNGPLRTVNEVLEVMIEQNDMSLRASEREVVMAQMLRGHIIAYGKNDPERYQKALDIYLEALEQADTFVLECRGELKAEKSKTLVAPDTEIDDGISESENEGKESDQAKKMSSLKKTLRSCLEVQHTCYFFVGTAYYQMKMDEEKVIKDSKEYVELEELEMKYYEKAKIIRKELLSEAHARAERAMRKVAAKTTSKSWTIVKMIPEIEGLGGIESRQILEKMDIISILLDKQATQIESWRESVIQRISKPLVDEDEGQETTGEEYEDSTKVQDELFVYSTILRALIADRNSALNGVSNFRMDQELREAVRAAQMDEGHAPKLMLQVIQERTNLKPKPSDGAMRIVISDLRSLATRLMGNPSDRAKVELKIVENYLKEVQKVLTLQTEILTELEKEQDLFHTAMNQRVEFYRQLQEISDTVAPYKEDMDEELDMAALNSAVYKETQHSSRLAQYRTKRRFLLHLRTESTEQDEARLCVICQGPFEIGVLTICGHQYCTECIRMWWREHRSCPVCKRNLHLVDFHEITYKPQEIRAQEEQSNNVVSLSKSGSERGSQSASSVVSIYADMSVDTMNEIKAIDLPGSYGTKIDTLTRHLIWLRSNDPGAKSIIFSQFSDFLSVLSGALTEFKIGNTSIQATGGIERFRRDASIECFLLDAKSDSSGLNLVNATHVFLCEPLINTAIELQAIARVHRIGQLRPTTVYMYLINDTVEEAIYEISVSRRLAHMSTGGGSSSSSSSSSRAVSGRSTPALQENALDKANSLELQQASISSLLSKGKSGGEFVEKDDLWNCLFGKPRREARALPEELQRDIDRHVRVEAAENRREMEHGLC